MTEAEWLASSDPDLMLRFLRRNTRYRKLRLFSVACCKRVEHLLLDERSGQAVKAAERFADRKISDDELRDAHTAAEVALVAAGLTAVRQNLNRVMAQAAASAAVHAVSQAWLFWDSVRSQAARAAEHGVREREYQCGLLRDIFGNPSRSAQVDESWLRWNDGTVSKIAQGIYEERAFDRLPILHDALLDAGCDDEDILAHCRGAGPHVCGCWVIDLLLGKE